MDDELTREAMTTQVLSEVLGERRFQDEKWGSNRDLDNGTWGLILGEEVGESCEAALENDMKHLRRELVQVAAVAVAWIEGLDRGDVAL